MDSDDGDGDGSGDGDAGSGPSDDDRTATPTPGEGPSFGLVTAVLALQATALAANRRRRGASPTTRRKPWYVGTRITNPDKYPAIALGASSASLAVCAAHENKNL